MQYICFHHLSLTYICSDKHIIISIMAQIHILLYLFLYSKLPFFQPIINCLHSVFEQYYTAKYKHNLPPNIQSEQNWNTNRIFSTALNVYSYLWVNWQVKINMKIINILPTSSSATCSKFHIVFIYLHFRSLSVSNTYIYLYILSQYRECNYMKFKVIKVIQQTWNRIFACFIQYAVHISTYIRTVKIKV